MPKLCALVAYYPVKLPAPGAGFPTSHNVTVHLTHAPSFMPKYRHYVYTDVQPGFAESDLDVYSKVLASLAWTRSLATVRKGFEIDVDLEKIWDKHLECKFLRQKGPISRKIQSDLRLQPSGICCKGCGCHDEYDGSTTICQPYPHHHGRDWV